MKLKRVEEGKVELFVPDVEIPEHGRGIAFYNPAMRLDRNLSVAALASFRKIYLERFRTEPVVFDALTATGVRALRYVKEAGVKECVACDTNENAAELARQNAKLNNINLEILNQDARKVMLERNFDVIDLDPFGTPANFLPFAARSLKRFSLLCVTATDTATLFGKYPDASMRRYFARSANVGFARELGLRILLSFIIRECAKFNKAFVPKLCYVHRHYVRCIGLVEKSKEKTNEVLKHFSPLYVSPIEWHTKPFNGSYFVGNIFLGPIRDVAFCKAVEEFLLSNRLDGAEVVHRLREELELPFYYDLTLIAKWLKLSQPKVERVVTELRERGYDASRSALQSTGVKTNAELKVVEDLVSELARF